MREKHHYLERYSYGFHQTESMYNIITNDTSHEYFQITEKRSILSRMFCMPSAKAATFEFFYGDKDNTEVLQKQDCSGPVFCCGIHFSSTKTTAPTAAYRQTKMFMKWSKERRTPTSATSLTSLTKTRCCLSKVSPYRLATSTCTACQLAILW